MIFKKIKSYGKTLYAIFAKSITWALLFSFLISFIGVMLTVGGPGQTGVGVVALEKVFYGDEVGSAILAGDTLERRIANGDVDEAFNNQVLFFILKAVITLGLFTVFLFFMFVLTESLQWNAFRKKNPFKKITLRGFWLSARINLILLFLLLSIYLVTTIFYIGMQYFHVVTIFSGFVTLFSTLFLVLVGVSTLHMVLMMNC